MPLRPSQRWLFGLLVLDAVVLALLEQFFLPLRFDGTALPEFGGDFPFPVTILVAVVTTPLLVTTTAKLVRPGLSWIPLLVWVVVLLVVGVAGPGGDVVLIQDWRTLLLLGGGALPGAMMLGGSIGAATKQAAAKQPTAGGQPRG
ncbi:MAG: putative rane protein [Amycolatopsis sp.]|jgi:hypothetical protein|uniref:hypothetical protein n=1 Tax=Amycolatopsis sp. TaxID=37632 RepID=UPI002602A98A|nr:hypothetical protein [Amycolatopsis sp.]MCU1684260.1 putative rane protein [Amycolatopsis sp.]